MRRPRLETRLQDRLTSRAAWLQSAGLISLVLAGCGEPPSGQPSASAGNSAAAAGTPASNEAPHSTAAGTGKASAETSSAGATSAPAADDTVRKPATVDEAAKVLDLRTFPQLPKASDPAKRVMASLSYQATAGVKPAFEFQRKNLLERKWKELPGSQISEQYASAQFSREGFQVAVSVFPGSDPGTVAVSLHNLGNVNLRKLPVPPGAKLQYSFPAITSFVTDATVSDTAAALRKLLLQDGWQPYGSAGDSMSFKQNAIQLDARVMSPPAQPGKTTIDFTAMQFSADLPAPPEAETVQYADQIKQLNLDMPGKPEELVEFYRKTLADAGWTPTTENVIRDRFEQTLIFANEAKDIVILEMRDLDGKTRASLRHQSRAEIEELDRRFKQQEEARKKKEEEDNNRPKPKATVSLPTGAKEIDASAKQIEFKVSSGKGKAAVDAITKQLQADGWEAEPSIGDDMAGQLSFNKDEHTISILYVDPSIIPAEITISATGVELEQVAGNKSNKE